MGGGNGLSAGAMPADPLSMLLADAWARALLLGLLGAIFGSFIATLVLRWPAGRGVGNGRSACDGCGRTLDAAELVPLASALWLRGRCRTCGARIDPLHWRVELASLAIGVASGLAVAGGAAVASAVFGWLLLTLALLDARVLWLPDRLTLPLALAGLAVGMLDIGPPLVDRVIGGAAGYAGLQAIRLGYRALRGREGMGGGDPKLFGAIGLWVGWTMLPIVLVLACLVGLGVVLFWLITHNRVQKAVKLPFGTLLAIAAYPAWIALLAWGR